MTRGNRRFSRLHHSVHFWGRAKDGSNECRFPSPRGVSNFTITETIFPVDSVARDYNSTKCNNPHTNRALQRVGNKCTIHTSRDDLEKSISKWCAYAPCRYNVQNTRFKVYTPVVLSCAFNALTVRCAEPLLCEVSSQNGSEKNGRGHCRPIDIM